MKTVNLSDPELTVYSGDHLLYELQLFQWTSAAAPSEKKGVTDTKAPTTAKRWLAFLHNHREVIAAMDFFTVPTLTFNVLYCFFIISHDRRSILHFNVTESPTSSWIVQQLREALPYEAVPEFLLFDHDAKYGFAVPATIEPMQITPVRTSIGSP